MQDLAKTLDKREDPPKKTRRSTKIVCSDMSLLPRHLCESFRCG